MTLFTDLAPRIMRDLMKEFDLSEIDAAAIVGNLGHESGGFVLLQEIHPSGAGGYGWAQWTGPRRLAYFNFCRIKGLDPKSYEANYGYLVVELKGSERRAIEAVKAAPELTHKVIAFEASFERAGVKNYGSREKYAQLALAVYRAANSPVVGKTVPPTPPTIPAGHESAKPAQPSKPAGGFSKTGAGAVAGGAAAAAHAAGLSWGWVAVVGFVAVIGVLVLYPLVKRYVNAP